MLLHLILSHFGACVWFIVAGEVRDVDPMFSAFDSVGLFLIWYYGSNTLWLNETCFQLFSALQCNFTRGMILLTISES